MLFANWTYVVFSAVDRVVRGRVMRYRAIRGSHCGAYAIYRVCDPTLRTGMHDASSDRTGRTVGRCRGSG